MITTLSAIRVNTIGMALQDRRLLPQNLLFLGRTPVVDASDDELHGLWIDHAQIADIISLDSEAVTYNAGRMSFESYKIPKIKHGTTLTESQIKELRDVVAAGGVVSPLYASVERRIIANLLRGYHERQEAMIIGSYLDSFIYDRLGIKIAATFGIPADLKIVVNPAWTLPLTAHPVQDIKDLLRWARVRYGMVYNRMTMSQPAFDLMIATQEFQDKAKWYLPLGFSFVNLTTSDQDQMMQMARRVTGMEIELYDWRYWSQNAAGDRSSYNFWPLDRVAFTNTAFDNDASVFDWANGEVIEPVVAALINSSAQGIPSGTRGPITYATGNPNLNPADITYWCTGSGVARRKVREMSAVFDIGSISDNIPVGEPY